MLKGGVVVNVNGQEKFCVPYYYSNSAWNVALPKIYMTNQWATAGMAGQIIANWVDANGNIITDPQGNPILVRTFS